jgi:MoaA/NifB/PqqE/SkfB family radical SAM enzyme
MSKIGYSNTELWKQEALPYLSAPTEVHFSVTNRCNQHCEHCYRGSSISNNDDLSLEETKKNQAILAAMGVFHVALGGGEAFERPDFGDRVNAVF